MTFGPFRLFPARQLLLEGDAPVRLGSRALEILLALVERASELVSKDELVARVWPNTFVEEGNLRVHIAALRRALGDGHAGNRYIATIPGRGYRFVAPVALAGEPASGQPSAPVHERQERSGGLPASLSRLLGRGATIDALVHDLQRHRLITIVGPGGIGKTTVAVAAAQRVVAAYPDGVHFVDLAPLSGPALVASTLASAIGAASNTGNLLPTLTRHLGDKRILILLDNCEHVIDAAATLAEDLLRGCPNLGILATSREALRAESERVRRLGPLELPAGKSTLTPAEALASPAVQLFVERAAATLDDFVVNESNAAVIADICRRLDGVALAIELAASRVDAFGVQGLSMALGDRFRLLTGRRTALPRHRTLGAMLDWSYEYLTSAEQAVLRRLAVFAGRFSLESATAVVAGEVIAARDVADRIADLVAKSLLTADVGGATVKYRLLDTTRSYALEKLVAEGERPRVVRRHAEHLCRLLERLEPDWETLDRADWLATYGPLIDDIRAAIDWSFSDEGDLDLGIRLVTLSAPVGVQLSLIDEFRARMALALQRIVAAKLDPALEVQFSAALGHLTQQSQGAVPAVRAAFERALDLAEQLGRPELESEALRGMWVAAFSAAEYPGARDYALRLKAIARQSADEVAVLVADRMLAQAMHYLGEDATARALAEQVMQHPIRNIPLRYNSPVQVDRQVSMRIVLARIEWLEGKADTAVGIVEDCIARALSDHAFALCHTLALAACPIAFWRGDIAGVRRRAEQLVDHAARNAAPYWRSWGELYLAAAERYERRTPGNGEALALPFATSQKQRDMLATLNVGFLGDQALARAGGGLAGWCAPEILRARAIALLSGRETTARREAETLLLRSLDAARGHNALAWELRTATSLAALRRDQKRFGEAREVLGPVYQRFREGLGTADLVAAKALLDALP